MYFLLRKLPDEGQKTIRCGALMERKVKRVVDEKVGIVKELNICIYGKGKRMWDGSWELGWDNIFQVTC